MIFLSADWTKQVILALSWLSWKEKKLNFFISHALNLLLCNQPLTHLPDPAPMFVLSSHGFLPSLTIVIVLSQWIFHCVVCFHFLMLSFILLSLHNLCIAWRWKTFFCLGLKTTIKLFGKYRSCQTVLMAMVSDHFIHQSFFRSHFIFSESR